MPPGVPGAGAHRPGPQDPTHIAARARSSPGRGQRRRGERLGPDFGDPSPAVTRLLERTLDRIGLRAARASAPPTLRWPPLADPVVPLADRSHARWQQDYPRRPDWFPLLLRGLGHPHRLQPSTTRCSTTRG